MRLPRYKGRDVAHSQWELNMLQQVPLETKIEISKRLIKNWYDSFNGKVYVSFSGGKDSTVLLHLVRSMYPDVKAVFVDTGLEYPELREFAMKQENVEVIKPKKNFRQIILDYGYPVVSKEISQAIDYARKGREAAIKRFDMSIEDNAGGKSRYRVPERWHYLLNAPFKISSYCCYLMKKSPVYMYQTRTKERPFLGTLASESALRTSSYKNHGCNVYDSRHQHSTPLATWTDNDVLKYIKDNKLEICSVYGKVIRTGNRINTEFGRIYEYTTTGVKRTGCMFCMFGCHRDERPNRFEIMKQTHPKIYEYCMKSVDKGGLGLDEVLNYLKIEH